MTRLVIQSFKERNIRFRHDDDLFTIHYLTADI
jgi:hypothetical protein